MNTHFTNLLTEKEAARLEAVLERKGFERRDVPYARYAFEGESVVVCVYKKGNKIFVQGRGTEDFVQSVLVPQIFVKEMNGEEEKTPHFGIDESGKGDYFGPLVIAGVYANSEISLELRAIGVRDSKCVGDSKAIRNLAEKIRAVRGIQYHIVSLGPERYNELYLQFNNLNKLLAFGHVLVAERLADKVPNCRMALSDQFARKDVLEQALAARQLDIQLKQRVRAESDLAVAAASILARERFVNWMDEASKSSGIPLPLGVSERAVKAGRDVIEKYGRDMLDKVAKMHFVTTRAVLQDQ